MASFASGRLLGLISERIPHADTSSAIKDAIKAAFVACEHEVLERARDRGWDDGCCAIGVLIDRRCTPARAYVANLGDSRAFACVESATPSADDRRGTLTYTLRPQAEGEVVSL